jgi:hypothetical protein
MSTSAKALLGVATMIQVPAIVFIVTLDNPPTAAFAPVVALAFAVLCFYFWDLPRNERVPQEKESNWRWAFFFAPFVAEPIYFFRFIWRDGNKRVA